MSHASGRHFLQIPGPTNVPDRVLRAIAAPTIDHRGPEFGALGREVLAEVKKIFKTASPVIVYPASGTGAWEAALVNTLSPGDRVLMCETGWFAKLWPQMAVKLRARARDPADRLAPGRGSGRDRGALAEDRGHAIKAVCVVHNETSTGVVSRIGEVRKAIDRASHPALLMVDTISSLASIDFRMDEWGVDVTVARLAEGPDAAAGSRLQRGVGEGDRGQRERDAPRAFWGWDEMLAANKTRLFPVHAGHESALRLARGSADARSRKGWRTCSRATRGTREATRRAVAAWGLERAVRESRRVQRLAHGRARAGRSRRGSAAPSDPRRVRHVARHGARQLAGKVFRIGHLGHFNDLMLAGTLAASRWGSGSPACRTALAACRPRSNPRPVARPD